MIQYPWDLYKSLNILGRLQKWEYQQLETLTDFFFSPLEKMCCLWNVGMTVRNMAGKVCEKLLECWGLLGVLKRSLLQDTFGILLVF